MQSIPPTISHLVKQVLRFLFDDLFKLNFISNKWLFLHDCRNILQITVTDSFEHSSQTLFQIMRIFELNFVMLWLVLFCTLTRIRGTSLAVNLLLIENLFLYLIQRFSKLQILLGCRLYNFKCKSGTTFDRIVLQRPVVNHY